MVDLRRLRDAPDWRVSTERAVWFGLAFQFQTQNLLQGLPCEWLVTVRGGGRDRLRREMEQHQRNFSKPGIETSQSKFLCLRHGFSAPPFLWSRSISTVGAGASMVPLYLHGRDALRRVFCRTALFQNPCFSPFFGQNFVILVKVTKKKGKPANDLRKVRVRRRAPRPIPPTGASAGTAGTAEGAGVDGATARPRLLLTTPPLGRPGRRNTGRRTIAVLVLLLILFLLLFHPLQRARREPWPKLPKCPLDVSRDRPMP